MFSLQKFDFFKNRNLSHSYDHLTKVFNRETINEYIDYLIANNRPFCLCITDVDNFKYVNDTYGHLVGDEILLTVTKVLVNSIANKGVVGRFGGDEFISVLEGVTDYKEIWGVFHSLNKSISTLKIEGLGQSNITVTSGISRFPLDANSQSEMFNIADKALYRGKSKGRNCFIIYLAEKHSNLTFEDSDGKKMSTRLMLAQAYHTLTANKDIKTLINEVFEQSCHYFMFDHVCIETPDGMKNERCYSTALGDKYEHIDYELLNQALDNIGLLSIHHCDVLKEINNDLYQQVSSQNVKAMICAKISAYGKDFGIIRADMKSGRVWQNFELNLILTVAHTIALILYYQNEKL